MGGRFRVIILILVLSGAGVLLVSLVSTWGGGKQDAGPHPSIQGRVMVEVLNGGGVPGVAWDATRALRDAGFDVVSFGNAGTYSEDPSVVMDRVGEMEPAMLVAEVLGIGQVRSEPDSTLFVDVTVRLGPDWTGPPSRVVEEDAGASWWDLRRFFRRKSGPEPENSMGP